MSHLDAMLDRLPLLYRDGDLVRQVLGLPAVQFEVFDEEALAVKRSHWFDVAYELDDVAKLAELLTIPREPWQNLAEFRAWVHSLIAARLRDGAVTPGAISGFVTSYRNTFERVTGIRAAGDPVLVENPPVPRTANPGGASGIEQLARFTLTNKGIDNTVAAFLLVGLAGGPESVPVIANLRTGQALVFLDQLPPGARLWIAPKKDGSASAMLNTRDVTARLQSISGFELGAPWDPSQISASPAALNLERGDNPMCFLTVAHYDVRGLDRYLLALAGAEITEGRFDTSIFDRSLYYQSPAALMQAAWTEKVPAAFEVQLAGGALLSSPGKLNDAIDNRDLLARSLDEGVGLLRAAGVRSAVRLVTFEERQPQRDYITGYDPVVLKERGPGGSDSLRNAGGVFGITSFENSTFR